MGKRVRVLHIDDSAADRELVCDALEREVAGFEVVQAVSRDELEARLDDGEFDVVLSDFNILGFDGFGVIDLVRKKIPDMPVIIVTGTGSESIAVEAMKVGAADYVIKTGGHFRRLPHTIQNALEKARADFDCKKVEVELEKYREHLEELVEDRTKELRKTVNLMADRENRMADLKETVQKLRVQLEEAGMTPVADDPLKEWRS